MLWGLGTELNEIVVSDILIKVYNSNKQCSKACIKSVNSPRFSFNSVIDTKVKVL